MARASNSAVKRLDGSAHGSYYFHAMIAAFASRRRGVQNRLILARVQVTPLPFWLMIVQLASRTAFRTGPIDHVGVSQVDVNLAAVQLKIHRIHKPGRLNAENTPIEFVILHAGHCRVPTSGVETLQLGNSLIACGLLALVIETVFKVYLPGNFEQERVCCTQQLYVVPSLPRVRAFRPACGADGTETWRAVRS